MNELLVSIPDLGAFLISSRDDRIYNFIKKQYDGFVISDVDVMFSIELEIVSGSEYVLERKSEKVFSLLIPYPFELGLIEGHIKMILGRYLLENKIGMVIHSTCLERDKSAHIFSAASGTGKSTLMKNSTQFEPMNDDNSIVFKNNNIFYVSGSPFNETVKIEKKNYSLPIAAVYFIYQSPTDIIEKISEDIGVKKLLKNFLAHRPTDLSEKKKIVVNAIEMFEQFVIQADFFELGLINSPGFWEVIYEYEKNISNK